MAEVDKVYDAIVVGAGIEGSATAYEIASRGRRVLLIEQFALPHTRGSSHGCTRITRLAYTQPYYVRMMKEAFRLWEEIEKKSGTKLYIRTGLLMFGPIQEHGLLDDVVSGLDRHKIEYEVFSGSEANRRYPDQLTLPSDYMCIFEKEGGILLADKALAAIQKLFLSEGGTILDQHKVTEIIPGPVVTVVTSKATFRTRKLVVTAGPWTAALVRKLGVELPFKTLKAEVYYWKVEDPKAFSPQEFPTFWYCPLFPTDRDTHTRYYGIPVLEYPELIKVTASHGGSIVDPDNRDASPALFVMRSVSKFINKFFKGVATTPSIHEPCLYTESPDENPVLDKHPRAEWSNIIIGAGFSGHGFKLSPVVGKILCELALDLPPSYDLTPFRIERFRAPKSVL